MILYAQGKLDDAAACFRRALDLEPDSADAHANQSVLWLLARRLRARLAGI